MGGTREVGAGGKGAKASAEELGGGRRAEEKEPRLRVQRGLPTPAARHPLAFGPSPDSESAFEPDPQFEKPCIGALWNTLAGREDQEK